jgi:hypothetical protein
MIGRAFQDGLWMAALHKPALALGPLVALPSLPGVVGGWSAVRRMVWWWVRGTARLSGADDDVRRPGRCRRERRRGKIAGSVVEAVWAARHASTRSSTRTDTPTAAPLPHANNEHNTL